MSDADGRNRGRFGEESGIIVSGGRGCEKEGALRLAWLKEQ